MGWRIVAGGFADSAGFRSVTPTTAPRRTLRAGCRGSRESYWPSSGDRCVACTRRGGSPGQAQAASGARQHEGADPCHGRDLAAASEDKTVCGERFEGAPGDFRRTLGRRDYALAPPTRSYLDELQAAGVAVHSVGKVSDLFAGRGIDEAHPGATNAEALESIDALIDDLDSGLVFANLIETDQRYGHRKDVAGFHAALREIDAAVGGWLGRLGAGDLLVISADHGCDPDAEHSDHTRESVPLLARFEGDGGRRHDGALADVGASVFDWLTGCETPPPGRAGDQLPGDSFIAGAEPDA